MKFDKIERFGKNEELKEKETTQGSPPPPGSPVFVDLLAQPNDMEFACMRI